MWRTFGRAQGPSRGTQFSSGRNRFSETVEGEERARTAASLRNLDEPPVPPPTDVKPKW